MELWNPGVELMSREEMRALQLEKLKRQLARVYAESPYYKSKFDRAKVDPAKLGSLDEIRHYPFFDKESSNNYTGDEELSKWLNEARNSVDPEIRKALYKKAQKRIIEQVYWIPNFGVKRFYGVHKDLDLKAGLDEVPRFQFAKWKK